MVKPCQRPVRLGDSYYQRHGSSCRKVDKDYLQTFLKNRSNEYKMLMKEMGVGIVDEAADVLVEIASKTEPVLPVPKVRKIQTDSLRNNALHYYDEGYEYPDAYIRLLPHHKYMMERVDSYQEENDMLTLAVNLGELAGYLLFVYDDASVGKVPMNRILDKEEAKVYNRFNGASLVFACPVKDDDVLFQEYESKGEVHYRFQNVADIEEINIGDPGALLFDVSFDSLLNNDVIPGEMKEELPKRITDRKK